MEQNCWKTVQVVEGVPVYGSERNFHINNEGIVEVISGKMLKISVQIN